MVIIIWRLIDCNFCEECIVFLKNLDRLRYHTAPDRSASFFTLFIQRSQRFCDRDRPVTVTGPSPFRPRPIPRRSKSLNVFKRP